jgi:hypothetical protein
MEIGESVFSLSECGCFRKARRKSKEEEFSGKSSGWANLALGSAPKYLIAEKFHASLRTGRGWGTGNMTPLLSSSFRFLGEANHHGKER